MYTARIEKRRNGGKCCFSPSEKRIRGFTFMRDVNLRWHWHWQKQRRPRQVGWWGGGGPVGSRFL